MLDIHQLLSADTIRTDLPGTSKDDVLNNLVDLLRGHPSVTDLEQVREAVFGREKVMSTGVGKALALPHAKTPAVEQSLAAFAITARPVEFGAIDNQPVQLLFLLVGNEAARSHHIKILSRVSRLMNRDAFRESLLAADSPSSVLALFEKGEVQLFAG